MDTGRPGGPPAAAIVTGAGSGIGLALALALGERGVHVVVVDRDGSTAEQAAASVRAWGGQAESHALDVTQRGLLGQLIERVAGTRPVDYMFNNAGVGGTLAFDRATPAHWDQILELNLRSVIDGTAAAYQVMSSQGRGHIINTASVAGLVPVPLQTLYNTTKAAVIALSRTLRLEAAPRGVRVSVVCPGNVATNIWATPIIGEPAATATAPHDAISTGQAAQEIMDGVDRNDDVIVFPDAARRLVELHDTDPEGWSHWARTELRRRSDE